jgi:hypothetical protein
MAALPDNYRYYQALGIPDLWFGAVSTGFTYTANSHFLATMRTSPTVVLTDLSNNGFPAGLGTVVNLTPSSFGVNKVANNTFSNGYFQFSWTASAEL